MLAQAPVQPSLDTGAASPEHPDAGPGIAYLLSQYPAISHTFFLQEVLGLRARGLHLETISINRPDRPAAQLPAAEAAAAETTTYVKGGNRRQDLTRLLRLIVTRPAAAIRGLRAIFALRGLTLRQRGFWLFYLAEALLVGDWMHTRKLRHLHVHFGGAVASVGLLTSIAWRIPYSLTVHGPEELLNLDSYRLREKVQQASFVLCISDFCRSQLCQFTPPSEWNKFEVVRLGVDPVVLSPFSRPAERTPDRPGESPGRAIARPLELVCTGRLVPAKGHRILLQALELLWLRGVRIHATLIGSGPEQATLQAFIARRGWEHNVTFTGALSHPETLAHLRKADLFALASFAEGIPVALMEAMSLGLPCVATTIAGIPELIRGGCDGLLVPPSNIAALAEALESLVNDPPLRRRLGSSGRQRIISDYNLPLNQKRLAQALIERTAAIHAEAAP